MPTDEFCTLYAALDRLGRVCLLAQLQHELTIAVRDRYGRGSTEVSPSSRAFNEMAHQLSGKIMGECDPGPLEKSIEDVVAAMQEWASEGGCSGDLKSAIKWVVEHYGNLNQSA